MKIANSVVLTISLLVVSHSFAEEVKKSNLKEEYKLIIFTAKELQLVLKSKCDITIKTSDLIRESSQFKKLISIKTLKHDKEQYDRVLNDTPCPKVVDASLVKP